MLYLSDRVKVQAKSRRTSHPGGPGSHPGQSNVEFVVDRVILDRFLFSESFGFPDAPYSLLCHLRIMDPFPQSHSIETINYVDLKSFHMQYHVVLIVLKRSFYTFVLSVCYVIRCFMALRIVPLKVRIDDGGFINMFCEICY